MKSIALIAIAAGLLSGCSGPTEQVKELRRLNEQCFEETMATHDLMFVPAACHIPLQLSERCGHGDIDACVLYGQMKNSPFDDPLEAKYWEFRAKGGNM